MEEPFEMAYKGYLLKCRPQSTPAGEFMPFAIVTQAASAMCVTTISPDLAAFASRIEAASTALSLAMRWVDEFG